MNTFIFTMLSPWDLRKLRFSLKVSMNTLPPPLSRSPCTGESRCAQSLATRIQAGSLNNFFDFALRPASKMSQQNRLLERRRVYLCQVLTFWHAWLGFGCLELTTDQCVEKRGGYLLACIRDSIGNFLFCFVSICLEIVFFESICKSILQNFWKNDQSIISLNGLLYGK